jgi:hypothetical protein
LGASRAAGSGGTGGDAGSEKSAGAAAAAAASAEWWRPWVVDPTHHALLGLLVHSGRARAGCLY